jgi:hypothetical protein
MTNTFLVRGFMPMAMVALALSACGKKDDTSTDGDTDEDTTTTTETGDSSVVDDGFFNPASASLSFELAYNASGELSTYTVNGQEAFPGLSVTFSDSAQNTCTLLYALDVEAFNAYVAAADAAATDYTDWLDAQGLVAGEVIAAGLYTPYISNGCTLNPAADQWTEDPHAAFLGNAWQMGWAAGVPDGVQSVLDENGGNDAFFGAGFDAAKAIGGYIRVPADFFGDGTRNLEAAGLVGEVDGSMEVQADADGNLVLIDAADTYTEGPSAGLVRIFSLYGITFN